MTMPSFTLQLNLSPAFGRHCAIRIESGSDGTATFEAPQAGLLPRVELTLSVTAEQTAMIYQRCSAMLVGEKEKKDDIGLDGISIYGVFTPADLKPQAFFLWSPRAGDDAHLMLAATLACFAFDRCNGIAGKLIEIARSYLQLQPLVTVISYHPMHLRIAPWVHPNDFIEIENHVRLLPGDGDLIIDASGIERFGGALTAILPVEQLLKRNGVVRWIIRPDFSEVLIQAGVQAARMEIIQPIPLSDEGHPIVLGGIHISSPPLMALARAGRKMDVIRAFRNDYPLAMEQASKAAAELLEIVGQYHT